MSLSLFLIGYAFKKCQILRGPTFKGAQHCDYSRPPTIITSTRSLHGGAHDLSHAILLAAESSPAKGFTPHPAHSPPPPQSVGTRGVGEGWGLTDPVKPSSPPPVNPSTRQPPGPSSRQPPPPTLVNLVPSTRQPANPPQPPSTPIGSSTPQGLLQLGSDGPALIQP